jgi:hypothetical protein
MRWSKRRRATNAGDDAHGPEQHGLHLRFAIALDEQLRRRERRANETVRAA